MRKTFLLLVSLAVTLSSIIVAVYNLSNSPSDSKNCDAVLDSNGYMHVVWQDNKDGEYAIYYERVETGVNPTFSNAIKISDSSGEAINPSIAVDGELLHIVWQDNRSGIWSIYYERRTTDGVVLVDDKRISEIGNESINPEVSAGNGTVFITWVENESGGYHIHYTILHAVLNYPSTISNPIPGNSSTTIDPQPTCSIQVDDSDGDTMTIYWYENTTGNWILRQVNTSSSNGTYQWKYNQATGYNTKYWWKVSVNDSINNVTAIYHFTTREQYIPSPPANLEATTISNTQIQLTWNKGDKADTTYIERNTVSSWTRGSGTLIYNGTATSYIDTSLSPHTTYYYQAWSYNATDNTYSTTSISASNTTSNTLPIINSENPSNGSTNIARQPTCSITITDNDGDTMTIYWYENTTGNWILRQTNTSISNGTYQWHYTQANQYNTKYYWKIAVNDSYDNTTRIYHFTTILEGTPIQNNPSPIDGATNVDISITQLTIDINDPDGDPIDWSIETKPNIGSASGNNEGNGTKTCSISGLQYHTTYTWYVNITDGHSWNNQTYTFTTRDQYIPNPPSQFTATPVSSSRITLSWIKDSNSDKTIIRCSATGYPSSLSEGDEIYNGTGTSYTHSDLQPGTTYYYSAWTWNSTDKVYSNSYSTTSATTLSNNPPTQSNPIPANNSVDVDISLTQLTIDLSDSDNDLLNWSIETSPNIGSSSGSNEGDGTKTCSISGLEYSTTYTWYVNVSDGYNWSNITYRFTTRSQYVPSPPTSFEAITVSSTQIALSWSKDSYADTTYIERNTVPSWNRREGTQIYNNTGTSYIDTSLSPHTTYYYQAWSYNTTDNTYSATSISASNTTSNTLPIINSENPSNGSTNIGIDVILSWSCFDPDGDNITYDVYFGVTNPPLKVSSNQSLNSYNPGTLNYSTTYYWYIVAWDTNDTSNVSSIWCFTTKSKPSSNPPSLPSNKPPVADANGPYSGLTYQAIAFDGSNSYDPDGSIVYYHWTFGDGNASTGKIVRHTYSQAGIYTVTLTVKDDKGKVDTDTTTAVIKLDSDADGWSDEDEEEYGSNPNNSSSTPVDTDSDGIPDSIDTDDDNDGLPDEIEREIGTDSLNNTGFINITINGSQDYLIDTNDDGVYDIFYNHNTNVKTDVIMENNSYLIDYDGDGNIDYIYNPAYGSITSYEKNIISNEGKPWILILIISAAIIVIALITYIYKKEWF